MDCRICNQKVIYNNKEKKLIKKVLHKDWNLSVCEKCLGINLPEYLTKNKSRIFNSLNPITKFAFNIPDDIYEKAKKDTYTRSFSDEYRKKLSHKNTLDFHIKKYGDEKGKEIYKERCKSRAVTLKNMIRRYGEIEGAKKWEDYRRKQSYTESLEYCLEKFGEKGYLIYSNRCKNKQLSKENFLKKYGTEEGLNRWESYRKKYIESFQKRSPHSKKSNYFFSKLKEQLPDNLTIYDSSTQEYYFINENGNFASVDFYIKEIDLVIEYYGDYWHANPSIYNPDDKIHTTYLAKDIWKRDSERLKIINSNKIIIVWELDANEDKIKELLNIINDELRIRN